MHRERVSENVFWFQSEVYAQVTAGVVAGPQWAVVIDTLALPDETLAIREFIERELSVPVRYVINTHYHADHAWGNCFFPGATVVAHAKCRDLLLERGEPSLESAKKQNPNLRQVKIVPPQMTFLDGEMTLRVGKKNLIIAPAYGHSEDGISVLVEEDRILFAGDSFMPIPYIVDGELVECLRSHQLMVVPSSYEGYGIVYLAGMGFGLPAIATTSRAASQIITHGADGFLVPPGDVHELAQCLETLVRDRSLLKAMSLAARRRYLVQPTWELTADRIRDFLLAQASSHREAE